MPDTATPFGLVVRFTLKPGAEEGFDSLTADTVAEIGRHDPATLVYACHTVPEADPPARVFYELYASRAGFDAHEQQPHTRHFLGERERYVDRTEVTFLHLDTAAGQPAPWVDHG